MKLDMFIIALLALLLALQVYTTFPKDGDKEGYACGGGAPDVVDDDDDDDKKPGLTPSPTRQVQQPPVVRRGG